MQVTQLDNPEEWTAFLSTAANSTLFHELQFLDYHAPGRFNFHHLVIKSDGRIVAVLPGALRKDGVLVSTSGASVGGLVVAPDALVHDVVAAVMAVQDYVSVNGWKGIEVTLPPILYAPNLGNVVDVALFHTGFKLQHRWYCHALPLDKPWEQTFDDRQRQFVRTARNKGVTTQEGGKELLEMFAMPFRDTYKRHGVPATHSEAEIVDLMRRFPDRVRIHLAMLDGKTIAALLVFHVTAVVGYTMYILTSAGCETLNGARILIADSVTRLTERGFHYLDLGPSASDMNFNHGVFAFKERLGAFGALRDRWIWAVSA